MPPRNRVPSRALVLLDLFFPIWQGAFGHLPALFALNYVWDALVLTVGGGRALRQALGPWRLLREALLVCCVGFVVDILAAVTLLRADAALGIHYSGVRDGHPVHGTDFGIGPFALHAAVVTLAGLVIWRAGILLLGRRRLGLAPADVRRAARRLALLTAPYLLLLPSYF